MPIHCPVDIKCLTADEFEQLDYRVMGHAYGCQNELGRLCDESAYQADLKARLLADGFRSVKTEVPITVTHREFTRKYFLDLLVDDALYELKAQAALIGGHEAQLLNYVLLLGLFRGKLLNFRSPKVQGQIVATSLTPAKRKGFTVDDSAWKEIAPACAVLKQTLGDLMQDWGAFLDLNLYQEALEFFLGRERNVVQQVRLARGALELGNQHMLVHAPGVAFRLTAFARATDSFASHLRRLLALTDLKAIQWINLNHACIEFTTITK